MANPDHLTRLLAGVPYWNAWRAAGDLDEVDLRGADLAGADLRDALYLTPSQVAAGRGDASTRLSAWLPRPRSWPGRSGA